MIPFAKQDQLSKMQLLKSLCAFAVIWTVVQGAIDQDLVKSLPGQADPPKFKHYSGYLKAGEGRMLHYWFLESQNNPKTDPVVMWTNGGPGCSSMDGLLSEHGPFQVTNDMKVTDNPYSWNKVANMLYLEQPAGVGYSYTPNQNYTTSDDQASMDNYLALQFFFLHYPEYAANDFFISGESYGGIYVPTLSARVVDDKQFNFKGFIVGNGLSDNNMNDNSMIYFGYYHGLWGQQEWDDMVSKCCSKAHTMDCDFSENKDPGCQDAVQKGIQFMWSLNVYNLYKECYQGPKSNKTAHHPIKSQVFAKYPYFQQEVRKLFKLSKEEVSSVPPCIDVTAVTQWLNRQDVRDALHIPNKVQKWEICSNEVGAHYIRQYTTMRNQYLKVLATGKHRIMVYNGDVDMACNFLGDEWFVNSLKQKEVKAWEAWHYSSEDGSQQVAGFHRQFENIAFVTVKGAGHMVPQDKPVPSLKMFSRFIQNMPLD